MDEQRRAAGRPALLVEAVERTALPQDLGRPGLAHLGVSPSGAADRAGHRLANRLVGNPEPATTVECLLGGLTVRVEAPPGGVLVLAVAGAPTPLRVDGVPTVSHSTLTLHDGARLQLGLPTAGLRSYLAVRGGLVLPSVLGSSAHDTLSGLGPPPLRPGDRLPVGVPTLPLPDVDLVPLPAPGGADVSVLGVTEGPRRDRLTDEGWRLLFQTDWSVSMDSDRVAVRLDGPTLPRRSAAELPSEGVVRGAVQLPAAGRPLLFGADHPVTGGYPVVAVLTPDAADAAARLRPGGRVRLALRR